VADPMLATDYVVVERREEKETHGASAIRDLY
jgi:hypothetical protein